MYKKKSAVLFLISSLICVFTFTWVPFIYSFCLSLKVGRGNNLHYAGIQNYVRLFSDDTFIKSLENTLFFALVIAPLVLLISFALACLINNIKSQKWKSVVCTMVYLPSITSTIAYSYFFKNFFATDGFLNGFLRLLHFTDESYNYLLTPYGARIAVILLCLWAWTGYYTIFILSGLQNIDRSMYESAIIDGANSFQTLRYITIPAISPVLLFVSVLIFGAMFQMITEIMILTKGGPAESTLTLAYYAYRLSFEYAPQFGYATTVSVVILILSIASTFILFFIFKGIFGLEYEHVENR